MVLVAMKTSPVAVKLGGSNSNTIEGKTMALSPRREIFDKLDHAFGAMAAATQAKAQTVRRRFIAGERQARSGYSPAVITEGGRIVWLAGMTGAADAAGKSFAGDFDAQVRATFAEIERTLAQAGGKLSDIVTMTVFITDPRNHRRMTEIRREIL